MGRMKDLAMLFEEGFSDEYIAALLRINIDVVKEVRNNAKK